MLQKIKENPKFQIFKRNVKHYTPEIIVVTTVVLGGIALIVGAKNSGFKSVSDIENAFKLEEILGDERRNLLARDDTRILKVEEDVYFLEVPTPTNENV